MRADLPQRVHGLRDLGFDPMIGELSERRRDRVREGVVRDDMARVEDPPHEIRALDDEREPIMKNVARTRSRRKTEARPRYVPARVRRRT